MVMNNKGIVECEDTSYFLVKNILSVIPLYSKEDAIKSILLSVVGKLTKLEDQVLKNIQNIIVSHVLINSSIIVQYNSKEFLV